MGITTVIEQIMQMKILTCAALNLLSGGYLCTQIITSTPYVRGRYSCTQIILSIPIR